MSNRYTMIEFREWNPGNIPVYLNNRGRGQHPNTFHEVFLRDIGWVAVTWVDRLFNVDGYEWTGQDIRITVNDEERWLNEYLKDEGVRFLEVK